MFLLVTLAMSRVEAGSALNRAERAPAEFKLEPAAAFEAQLTALDEAIALRERTAARLKTLDEALSKKGWVPGLSLLGIRDRLEAAQTQTDAADERRALERALRKVDAQRGQIETSIAVLESRRATLPILIDPTGLSRQQKPYFIECDAEGATAYRVQDDFEYFVPRADLAASGDFGRYLRRVRAIPGALVVLLVREDGIRVSDQVESLAVRAGIRVARLPLPGGGPLDFALLRQAEGSGQGQP